VQRLSTENAKIRYLVASEGTGAELTATVAGGSVTGVTITNPGSGYYTAPQVLIAGPGTGARISLTVADGAVTKATVLSGGTGYDTAPAITVDGSIAFGVADELPADGYFFALKHLECFNDGIKVSFRAEEKHEGGVLVANDRISLRVMDPADVTLYEFEGSLNPDAKDDYGN